MQSIDVIAQAQSQGELRPLALIICDEAHRTTGGTLAREDESAFVKVYGDAYLQGSEAALHDRHPAAVRRQLQSQTTIRLHDMRHTHATILLGAGSPVTVVSERLGHASATSTLGIYAHVTRGMQRGAAATFAALVAGEVQ